MTRQIFYNQKNKTFTFSEYSDGQRNLSVVPAKYSPEDPYGKYRRMAKERDAQ